MSIAVSKGESIHDKECPLCGYYREDPKDEAPHLYYCHTCNRGFNEPNKPNEPKEG